MWIAYLSGGIVAGIAIYFFLKYLYTKHMAAVLENESNKNLAKAQVVKEAIESELQKAADNSPSKYDPSDW